jgi:citrate synthase
MSSKRYLTATEVSHKLGISRATLYAYVSRGLVRSEPLATGSRERRYHAEDVEALLARKHQRNKIHDVPPPHLTPSAIHTAISLIQDGKLYYRGVDSDELALQSTFERVALHIWLDKPELADEVFEQARDFVQHSWRKYATMLVHQDIEGVDLDAFATMQAVLPVVGADDLTAYDLHLPRVAYTGARVLCFLTAAIADEGTRGQSIAQTLQAHWRPELPALADMLNIAMILSAAHANGTAAYMARLVASTGGTPYAVTMASMSALVGIRQGGSIARVEAFFDQIVSPEQAESVLVGRLQRGEMVAGFRHPQYPEGDPRAMTLLRALAQADVPNPDAITIAQSLQHAASELMDAEPTLKFALVTLRRAYELPYGSAQAIFALARTVSWIGHAIEQYERDEPIPMTMRYDGQMP